MESELDIKKVDMNIGILPLYFFPFVVTSILLTLALLCCPKRFSQKVRYGDTPSFSVDELVLVQQSLKQNGYAVVKRVLDGEDLEEAWKRLWSFLQGGVSKAGTPLPDEVQTWHSWPSEAETSGLIQTHGIGQSSFMWYIRTRPLVSKCFSALWDTSELLVSFEGCLCFRPWQNHNKWKTKPENFHLTHGPKCALPAVVQGMVALSEMNPRTGGIVVLPKSHLHHQAYSSSRVKMVSDRYVHVPASHPAVRKHPPEFVKAEKGDLILWDSRLIHAFRPADLFPIKTKDPEMLCTVAFVTMVPRVWATEDIQEARKKAFKGHKTSTSVPHELEIIDDPFPEDRTPPINRKTLEYANNSLI